MITHYIYILRGCASSQSRFFLPVFPYHCPFRASFCCTDVPHCGARLPSCRCFFAFLSAGIPLFPFLALFPPLASVFSFFSPFFCLSLLSVPVFLFFLYFFKKVAETFCGYLKSCYLCTRFPQGGLISSLTDCEHINRTAGCLPSCWLQPSESIPFI